MGQWFQDLSVCISTVRTFCSQRMLSQVVVDAAYKSFTESRRGIPGIAEGWGSFFFQSRPLWHLKTEVRMMRITRRSWKSGNGCHPDGSHPAKQLFERLSFFSSSRYFLERPDRQKKGSHPSLSIIILSLRPLVLLPTLPGNGMVGPIETQHPTRSHGVSVGSGPWRLKFGALSSQSGGFLPKCISTSSSKSVISKKTMSFSLLSIARAKASRTSLFCSIYQWSRPLSPIGLEIRQSTCIQIYRPIELLPFVGFWDVWFSRTTTWRCHGSTIRRVLNLAIRRLRWQWKLWEGEKFLGDFFGSFDRCFFLHYYHGTFKAIAYYSFRHFRRTGLLNCGRIQATLPVN